jgi:hypothetical protein
VRERTQNTNHCEPSNQTRHKKERKETLFNKRYFDAISFRSFLACFRSKLVGLHHLAQVLLPPPPTPAAAARWLTIV